MQTRYPGLSSFTTAQKDIFFGRKQETRDLTNLLSVERTVVLFSKSGYGKTSLLQAGVMPLLYSRQIVPVPIRFGTDVLSPEQHFSIQFDTSRLNFLGKTEQEAQKQAQDTSTKETFWEQIRRSPFGEGQQQFTPLLIFDQFEELFTLYPDKEKRARFVAELANLVQERLPENLGQHLYERLERGEMTASEVAAWETLPLMKFIFSIRSDMLHFMDELSEPMPYILRSRYQLFGLGEEQAREAIVAPAALGSVGMTSSHPDTKQGAFASPLFGYTPEALAEILAVLSKNKEVESFQLQAVCQAIEEKIMAQPVPFVSSDFYGGVIGIGIILEESYRRRLDNLIGINTAWPMAARRLLENVLVNKNERRKSVDLEELLDIPEVSVALLDELERIRLVRKEPRLDSYYYEISHDTWLRPILNSKQTEANFRKKQEIDEVIRRALPYANRADIEAANGLRHKKQFYHHETILRKWTELMANAPVLLHNSLFLVFMSASVLFSWNFVFDTAEHYFSMSSKTGFITAFLASLFTIIWASATAYFVGKGWSKEIQDWEHWYFLFIRNNGEISPQNLGIVMRREKNNSRWWAILFGIILFVVLIGIMIYFGLANNNVHNKPWIIMLDALHLFVLLGAIFSGDFLWYTTLLRRQQRQKNIHHKMFLSHKKKCHELDEQAYSIAREYWQEDHILTLPDSLNNTYLRLSYRSPDSENYIDPIENKASFVFQHEDLGETFSGVIIYGVLANGAKTGHYKIQKGSVTIQFSSTFDKLEIVCVDNGISFVGPFFKESIHYLTIPQRLEPSSSTKDT